MATSSIALGHFHSDVSQARLNGFMDESVPAAVAWLGMDFGQKERAFDLSNARQSARQIVAAFFDGATFFNTTGLWKRTQNGGLTVMLYHPLFTPDRNEQRQQVVDFIERARSCGEYLRATFQQQAVALVAQTPGGKIRVEFIEEGHKVIPPEQLSPPVPFKAGKYAQAARGKARMKRLPGPTVQDRD